MVDKQLAPDPEAEILAYESAILTTEHCFQDTPVQRQFLMEHQETWLWRLTWEADGWTAL